MAHAFITKEEALSALSSLDDYARMDIGVDAWGTRTMLERFILQAQHGTVGWPSAGT